MNKYIFAMFVEMKLIMKYKFNVIVNSTMLVLPLLGNVFLFKILFSNNFVFKDYTLSSIFSYYFWALFIYTVLPVYAWYDMTEDIKSGGLAYFLSRPYNFILHYYFQILGSTILWIFLNFLVLIPFIIIFKEIFIFPSYKNLLIGILFFIISFNLAIVLGFILQILSFFFGEPSGYMEIYGWVISFVGGSIIPIDILPKFFNHLPFRFLYFIPAKAFTSEISNFNILFFESLLYLGFFIIILLFLWKKGLKIYTAFGG